MASEGISVMSCDCKSSAHDPSCHYSVLHFHNLCPTDSSQTRREEFLESACNAALSLAKDAQDLTAKLGGRLSRLEAVARDAKEYVHLEEADDPTVTEPGTALHSLAGSLAALEEE